MPDRILVTHTGSLPRPPDLTRMMFAKEDGVPVDRAALAGRVAAAVGEIVDRQLAAGIDVVNDGEMSKPSYATYIKDRLHGFGGESRPMKYADLVEFPELTRRLLADPGRSHRKTPGCDGPISVADMEPVHADIARLKKALAARSDRAPAGFMSAASPGVISLFFANHHYPDHQSYLFAIADAMRSEYQAIADAGLILQIDCPDLAMGRHMQFADLDLDHFRRNARLHIEALNHALSGIPPERMRLHLCWGNYEGPHHRDVPLADIIDLVLLARPSGLSFEAANPRHAHEWKVFETVKLPPGKKLIPGVIESKSNFIEHPELVAQRIGRYAGLVGRENVMAGCDCGFGTFVGLATVEPGVVWAKLASLREGAEIASRPA